MTTLPINSLQQRGQLIFLQSLTLVWMLVECAVSLISAVRAHSPVLFAFGIDSFVELLSAALVVLALASRFRVNRRGVNRISGILLFALAAIVAVTSIAALAGKLRPQSSPLGIVITAAALIAMPLLAWQKRKLARRTGNSALAADSVQSATCAYLALVTLAGLALNSAFGITQADSVAALAAIPILIVEARRAMRGHCCGCC